MSRRIKCGVLGAGWWATFAHIPALSSCAQAELISIQNDNPAEARRIAEDFGVPYYFTSAEDLLAVEDLEAIIVSSSPYLHFPQAWAALASGKHVLIEKPMTIQPADAWKLVDLARQRELKLLISCPWHYTRHSLEAQRLIRSGTLGELRMISILMTNPVDHLLRGVSTTPTYGRPYIHPRVQTYSDPSVAGGGHIYTQVSHIAAYLSFLTGKRTTEVFARFHNDGARVDIYDTLNLRMEDGTLVGIASTGAIDPNHRHCEVRIFGTAGVLLLELWSGTMQWLRPDGTEHVYPPLAAEAVYPHAAPAIDLVNSIANNSPPHSPGELGAIATDVIEAACRSAGSNKNIVLKERAGLQV